MRGIYMIEESDFDNGKDVHRHKLPWRSTSEFENNSVIISMSNLYTLVEKLDSRAFEASTANSGKIQLKQRIESVLSIISPPKNSPLWTVDTTFPTPTEVNVAMFFMMKTP